MPVFPTHGFFSINRCITAVVTKTNGALLIHFLGLFTLITYISLLTCLQCFDAVGWVSGRASGLKKIWSDEVLAWLSSAAKCKQLAYGSADATATPPCLLQQNPEWFILLVPTHLGRPGLQTSKFSDYRAALKERERIGT